MRKKSPKTMPLPRETISRFPGEFACKPPGRASIVVWKEIPPRNKSFASKTPPQLNRPHCTSIGEQMLSAPLPQLPSLQRADRLLRSFEKSIFLVQPVLCARFSKTPRLFEIERKKSFPSACFLREKQGFCALPTNGHLIFFAIIVRKKSPRRKKSLTPQVGTSFARRSPVGAIDR
jgi:hypothetical protein